MLKPAVATDEFSVPHVPPPLLLSATVDAGQTFVIPLIADGSGLTVMVVVEKHPVPTVYVIIVVPVVRPVTIPVAGCMVATVLLELAHVPPLFVSVICAPWQTLDGPEIAGGNRFTVTTMVAIHPVVAV